MTECFDKITDPRWATIDDESMNQFTPHYEGVIYGYRHCDYFSVARAFEGKEVQIRFGNGTSKYRRRIYEINPYNYDFGTSREMDRTFKDYLVDIVLENCRSLREGLPIIPVLFCIDTTNNEYPTKAENIVSKKDSRYTWITHKEIRRAYKLCYDPQVDPLIREVAKKTFHFVRVEYTKETNQFNLKAISAPWEERDWQKYWPLRKSVTAPDPNKQYNNWRGQANDFVSVLPKA